MGQSLIADSRRRKDNNNISSVLFILSFLALSLFGLISIYSATYPIAQNSLEIKEFDFVIRQAVYLGIGIVCGLLVLFLPEKVISALSYVLMLGCIGILGVNSIAGNLYLSTELSFQIILLVSILFFASYFAKKGNSIERLRDLLMPVLCVIAMIFLILTQNNVTFAVLFFVISLIMFVGGGVGFGGALLLVLFAIVPTVCSILSDENKVVSLLKLIVPGYGIENSSSNPGFIRLQAISSGRLLGKGLGAGQFKYGSIDGIYDKYIFCNICEELGLIGLCIFVVLFATLTVSGFKIAINQKDNDSFASNAVTGLISHLFICMLFNLSCCFNFTTFDCVSLPFVSFGPTVIVFVVESFLVYKLSKQELNNG